MVLKEYDLRVIAILIASAGIIMALAIWRELAKTKRFLADAYSSFQITDDGNTLTKVQKDTPTVSLARSEIKRVQEFQGKGFRICTDARDHNIWVPCELEDYEQFRTSISAIPGVEFTTQSHSWVRSYAVIATFLTVFAISVLASDKRVVVATSLGLSGYLVFGFVKHFRNPNLTSRGKRRLLANLFVAVCFLVRAIVIWYH